MSRVVLMNFFSITNDGGRESLYHNRILVTDFRGRSLDTGLKFFQIGTFVVPRST